MIENTGQIQLTQPFGTWIAQYAADTRFTRYLEIGTWNGRGSTCCMYAGFLRRADRPTLDSYEVSKPRVEEATAVWKHVPIVRIHHGHVLEKIPTYEEVRAIHPNMIQSWYDEDMRNLATAEYCPAESPEVVLLDGSEYLTYFEFLALRDLPSIRVFLLDDAAIDKNRRVVEYLSNHPQWIQKMYVPNERNGWAVFEKISESSE